MNGISYTGHSGEKNDVSVQLVISLLICTLGKLFLVTLDFIYFEATFNYIFVALKVLTFKCFTIRCFPHAFSYVYAIQLFSYLIRYSVTKR